MADHEVKLNYNAATDTLIVNPPNLKIQANDTLRFSSPQGPVNVNLEPAHLFDKDTWSSGQAPIRVLQAGKYVAHCGVVINGRTIGWPKTKGFGTGDPPIPPKGE